MRPCEIWRGPWCIFYYGSCNFLTSAILQVVRVDMVSSVESQDSLLLHSVDTWLLWMRPISLHLSANHAD